MTQTEEQIILNVCEDLLLIASAQERPMTTSMRKYLDLFSLVLSKLPAAAPEMTEQARNAQRFLFEQNRAWAGLPEYTISTHFGNDGVLEEGEFKAARAAHIDAQILGLLKP